VRYDITAASAAYLNKGMEPTARSVRSAPASGSGSYLAFGVAFATLKKGGAREEVILS